MMPQDLHDSFDVPPDLDIPESQARRLPLLLIVDTSYSMTEGDRIGDLNRFLPIVKTQVMESSEAALACEIAIVRCGGSVELSLDWCMVSDMTSPKFEAGGNTPLGEAVLLAISKVRERREYHKTAGTPYFVPWIFVITDGQPTDGESVWARAVEAVSEATSVQRGRRAPDAKVFVFAADESDLVRRPLTRLEVPVFGIQDMPAEDFFKWIGESLRIGSTSQPDEEPQIPMPDQMKHFPAGPMGESDDRDSG